MGLTVGQPRAVTLAAAVRSGPPVLLDGGLATRLEARGHDLSTELWSARLLLDEPGEVRAAHADFRAAGARIATTASYQVSFEGLAQVGIDAVGCTALFRRSVRLAREAMGECGWVAASIGPYGATLADGSEYTGRYAALDPARGGSATAGREFLRRWHARRLAALVGDEVADDDLPDVLAMETVPCLAEAQVLVGLAQEWGGARGIPAWVSFTCVGDRLRSGEPAAAAFALARGVDAVLAVGVNCTDPTDVAALVQLAARESGKPVVVYPNSGETWDARARSWRGATRFTAQDATRWVEAGARLVGGCCRVAPEAIADIAAALGTETPAAQPDTQTPGDR